jgi:hypothetical protein
LSALAALVGLYSSLVVLRLLLVLDRRPDREADQQPVGTEGPLQIFLRPWDDSRSLTHSSSSGVTACSSTSSSTGTRMNGPSTTLQSWSSGSWLGISVLPIR